MAINYTTLKTELTADPRGYGYQARLNVGDQQGVATLLNTIRDGTNQPANPTAAGGAANGLISVNRGSIPTQELVEAIVQSEMPSNASQRDWLIMVASGVRVRVDAASTARAGLLAIFGAVTATRANLTVASSQTGSRAQELFGVDTTINTADIAQALAS